MPKITKDEALRRRQKFAEHYAVSGNAAQSAREALGIHRKSAHCAGAQLAKEPIVASAVLEGKKLAMEKVGYTVERAMTEAQEAIDFAKITENANAYVKAVELRAKLSGLLEQKNPLGLAAGFQVLMVGVRDSHSPTQNINSPQQIAAPQIIDVQPLPPPDEDEEFDPWA